MHSVDMWNGGRRTDTYRAKHRILGENFSLSHQLIFTNDFWSHAGMKDAKPKADLQAWLDRTRPRFSTTWFARGDYDRALAIYRDKGHVFSLAMINGGNSQYDNSPYYPLPFASGIVAGTPDSGPEHAQLLPKFTLPDGTQLLPVSYIKDIRSEAKGKGARVSYRQDALAKLGKKGPSPDERIKLETTYSFEPGIITRTDTYTPAAPLQIKRASLEFASYSDAPKVEGRTVRFGQGDVSAFEVSGLEACTAEATHGADPYRAPEGPMASHVSCASENFTLDRPLTIKWTLRYR
jgi:hypothetical protein